MFLDTNSRTAYSYDNWDRFTENIFRVDDFKELKAKKRMTSQDVENINLISVDGRRDGGCGAEDARVVLCWQHVGPAAAAREQPARRVL